MRELADRRARGQTIGEISWWLAELGTPLARKQLRIALEHVDRRLARAAEAVAFTALLGPPTPGAEGELLRATIAMMTQVLAKYTEECLQPRYGQSTVQTVVFRLDDWIVFAKIVANLARAHRDLVLARVAADGLIEPTDRVPDGKKSYIPPGLVEEIREKIYGLRS